MAATATDNQHAYYISGHGGEATGTFIVPDGCTIVVKVHSGELMYNSSLKYLKKFCKLPINTLINPTDNIYDIINNFGSVEIYNAGESCPNFNYSLLAYYDNITPSHIYYEAAIGSGLIDLLKLKSTLNCDSIRDVAIFNDSMQNIPSVLDQKIFFRVIRSLFNNSFYPSTEMIDRIISREYEKVSRAFANDTTMSRYDQFKYIFETVKQYVSMTQSQLCAKTKGTFYNFICRPHLASDRLFNVNIDEARENVKAKFKYNVESIKNTRHIFPTAYPLLLSRLSETVGHRRKYIKQWNDEKPFRNSRYSEFMPPPPPEINTDDTWHKPNATHKGWWHTNANSRKNTNTNANSTNTNANSRKNTNANSRKNTNANTNSRTSGGSRKSRQWKNC